MAAKKEAKKEQLENDEPEVAQEAPKEVEAAPVKASKKVEYPEVVGNGKFQVVAVAGGHVIYNPSGARASGVETEDKARDTANKMNVAMGLK